MGGRPALAAWAGNWKARRASPFRGGMTIVPIMRPLDTNLLLRAYAAGIFPMADSRRARDVYWVEPAMRGILPLDGFHLSRSLAKTVRSDRYAVTADRAFARVIAACAEAR